MSQTLHQILVSDLVAPLMIAEYADMTTATRTATRLGEATWTSADLVVYCAPQSGGGFVDGPPLLAVEVASPASRAHDLGAKKDVYERAAVPCYWVVEPVDGDVLMHLFELREGGYAELAVLGKGDSCRLTEPFKIEIRPDELFQDIPAWRGPVEGADMDNGADLPLPEDAFAADAFAHRWPTGAEKVELLDGAPVFYGRWDERDVAIAERAYPGRRVRLDQPPGRPGTLTVLPASAEPERAATVKIEVPGDA